ncbi:MAG: lamin tail domain-containing protein [Pyrinomonadaceae bacterium]|nr:lamin tail domain-containing protein [Pyrinomonadaceae bacterium]
MVTDNLPAGVTFVSCASTGTGVCGGSGNNRTVSFASLVSGESATITLVATVNSAGGTTVDNTATVSSATADSNPANNSATASTSVQAVLPLLTIDDLPNIAEGNTGTSTATFTVTLSPSSTQTVTVNYTTSSASPATATAGTDYQTASGTLTFNPGDTSKPIVVTINGDTLVEPNETFFVDLSAAVNANISDPQAVGTIVNDDTANLVISQVYGGGGLSGATYTHDFVEIYNRGTTTVDFSITAYSVQYAGVQAAFGSAKTDIVSGTIAPGKYFLIQGATGGGVGVALPTPDATGSINLNASTGKVALVLGTVALTGNCPGDVAPPPTNPAGNNIVDFVGYGFGTTTSTPDCFEGTARVTTASGTQNNRSIVRDDDGCEDTNDNAANFTYPPATTPPVARNQSTPANPCP